MKNVLTALLLSLCCFGCTKTHKSTYYNVYNIKYGTDMIISHPAGWDIGEILPYSGTMCNDELIVVESVFEGTILPKRRLLTDETYSRDGKFYHAIEYVVNNDTIYVDGLQPKDVQRMFKQ